MLTPNTILQNRYCIIRQLGQGGMGTVYEAIDRRFDSQVAIKETHFNDEVLRKQFEREARLLNRLRHPAMTRVIDHFSEGNGQFLVMDFITGEDLWEMLQRHGGAFPPDKVLEWADQLLDALNYLHKQEPPIIHRDIKPQNLKLSNTGQIILLDFGLAKGFAGHISRVTTSGSIFGYTPNYAPLEQIQGTGTDARSDLYSLAATLYHLMTGVVPPDVLTRLTAATEKQSDPLRSAHEINSSVPADVAAILNKTMAVAKDQRFASAAEMRNALRNTSFAKQLSGSTDEAVFLPPTIITPATTVSINEHESGSLLIAIADSAHAQHEKGLDSTEIPKTLNTTATAPQTLKTEPVSTSGSQPLSLSDLQPTRRRVTLFTYIFAVVSGVAANILQMEINLRLFGNQIYPPPTDAWLQYYVTKIMTPLITFLCVGVVFGFVWPKLRWKWGLWLAALPALHGIYSGVVMWIQANPVYKPEHLHGLRVIVGMNIAASILFLIGALIGAYIGTRLSLSELNPLRSSRLRHLN